MKLVITSVVVLFVVVGQLTDGLMDRSQALGRPGQERIARNRAGFWRWFQAHDKELFAVKTAREPVCDRLKAELNKIHPDLVFEFGPVEQGRREFVISAGGIREAFPAVIQLAKAAPPLPRWRIVQFRPRTSPMRVEMDGVAVDPDQVEALVKRQGKGLALIISIVGYKRTASQTYEQIGYLLLDHALGEYTMETRIGAIEFVATPNRPTGKWISLRELVKLVDAAPRH